MTEVQAIGYMKAAIQRYNEDDPIDPDSIKLASLMLLGEDGFIAEARIESGDIFKVAGTSNSLVADRYTRIDSKKWIGKEKEEN